MLRRSYWKNVNHWLGCQGKGIGDQITQGSGFVFPRLLIPDRLQTRNRPIADFGNCSWGARGEERPARAGFVRINWRLPESEALVEKLTSRAYEECMRYGAGPSRDRWLALYRQLMGLISLF